MSPSAEDIALANCAREPVHIPGRIQSFGYLLAVNGSELIVSHASTNVDELLSADAQTCIGRPLGELVGNDQLLHAVRGAQSLPTIRTQRERIGTFEIVGRPMDVALAAHADGHLLELEGATKVVDRPAPAIARLQAMIATLPTEAGLEELLEAACNALRRLSGIDRVMAYRFMESGDGEVLAEARAPRLDSFVGLRYPASDIPSQVRDLMLRMPFRVIADVGDPHVDLISARNAPPVDLSLTHLRGVSPIHARYLENMGVGATANIGLIVRDRLWGMFALHHYRRRLMDADQRSTCELFGTVFSSNLQRVIETELLDRRRRVASVLDAVRDSEGADLAGLLRQFGRDFLSLVDADGVAVVHGDDVYVAGDTPPSSAIHRVCNHVQGDTFSTHTLAAVAELTGRAETGGFAGVFCTPLSLRANAWLLFFRPEVIAEVRWAGSPEKDLSYGKDGPRLNPRASFAEYREQVRGQSRPWTLADTTAAMELRSSMITATLAQLDRRLGDRERSSARQALVIAELNHRIKNILSLVRSVARRSRAGSEGVNDYVEAFEARLGTLARAHDLLIDKHREGASFEGLLELELSPYRHPHALIETTGPAVLVKPDAVPTLSLVLHELVSNAIKHGALSGEGNGLGVSWHRKDGGLAIEWQERVERPVARNPNRGFGLTLMQRAVPQEFGGTCRFRFESTGLCASIWLPSRTLSLAESGRSVETESGRLRPQRQTERRALLDNYILLLEDNALIGMELEETLTSLGYSSVRHCGDAADALACIAEVKPLAALMDVQLQEGTSLAVLEQLETAGVPVVLLTGYDENTALPEGFEHVPRLSKPVDTQQLVRALATLPDKS